LTLVILRAALWLCSR